MHRSATGIPQLLDSGDLMRRMTVVILAATVLTVGAAQASVVYYTGTPTTTNGGLSVGVIQWVAQKVVLPQDTWITSAEVFAGSFNGNHGAHFDLKVSGDDSGLPGDWWVESFFDVSTYIYPPEWHEAVFAAPVKLEKDLTYWFWYTSPGGYIDHSASGTPGSFSQWQLYHYMHCY